MEQTTEDKVVKAIEHLVESAIKSSDCDQALKHTQACCNLAHVVSVLKKKD